MSLAHRCVGLNDSGSQMLRLHTCSKVTKCQYGLIVNRLVLFPPTRPLIRALQSLQRKLRTTTQLMKMKTKCVRRIVHVSSFSVLVQTALVKVSNSITAVYMQALRCEMPDTKQSWSTATLRQCQPTTTLLIVCISNH